MKQKKKPKDNLIQSVLEDLKQDSADPSFRLEMGDVDSEKSESVEIDPDFLAQLHDPEQALPTTKKQKPVEDEDKTSVLGSSSEAPAQSKTKEEPEADELELSDDKTMVASSRRRSSPQVETKTSFGGGQGKISAFETQFAHAENLKMAQLRILELEKEIERLRKENEVFASAGEISKQKLEDLISKIHQLDKQKHDLRELNESELQIFKDGLLAKESEIHRLRNKVEELESRLSNDLRKVRVRERELENRLELSKAEKAALLRAKDETILELKRKTDSLENEIENYQNKIIELGQRLEGNQDQFARTVRALRIALTNLEVNDSTSPSITLAPLKKAE